MDFTKFVDLLERRSLFFCRSDRFEDPFEGSVSPLNAPAIRDLLRPHLVKGGRDPAEAEKILASFEGASSAFRQKTRQWTLINCWHHNEHESAAMWKLYAKMEDAVAVQTTLGDLKRSFAVGDDSPVYVGDVRYIDYEHQAIPEGNAFLPYLHKRLSFAHEREVRAVMMGKIQFENGQIGDNRSAGDSVEIDLEALVQAVYVAPTCSGWFSGLVARIAMKYGLHAPIHKSALGKDPIF